MIDSYFFFISGIIVVLAIAFDFLYTTLSFNGAGFMSRMLASAVSTVFLFFCKRSDSREFLKFSGLIHVLCSVTLWISLLWAGLYLIMLSSNLSIVNTASYIPADPLNKFYFSGYILSTLGLGEYIPNGHFWQIVTVLFSFSGLIFITTAITYLINLNSAVLHKRSLGLYISNLGESPDEIIINTYSEGSFERLIKYVPSLQAKINRHNQNHYAYPISHYFYSTSREESLVVSMAALSEALTVIKFHIDKKASVDKDLHPLHHSIHEFLKTIEQSFAVKASNYENISVDRKKLNERGISFIDDTSIGDKKKESTEKRRKLFSNLLKSSGWSWEKLYEGRPNEI